MGDFSCILSSTDFVFKIIFFEKFPSGMPPECQTLWVQIRPNILPGLIWVQADKTCKKKVKVGNGVARLLKKLLTSEGDYSIKQ